MCFSWISFSIIIGVPKDRFIFFPINYSFSLQWYKCNNSLNVHACDERWIGYWPMKNIAYSKTLICLHQNIYIYIFFLNWKPDILNVKMKQTDWVGTSKQFIFFYIVIFFLFLLRDFLFKWHVSKCHIVIF